MSSGEKSVDTSFNDMPYLIAKSNGIEIKLSYEHQMYDAELHLGGTKLEDTYRIHKYMDTSQAELNGYYFLIKKNDNSIESFTAMGGLNNPKVGSFEIEGRGIGEAIPSIRLNNISIWTQSDKIETTYKEMKAAKEMIVKSFKVISSTQALQGVSGENTKVVKAPQGASEGNTKVVKVTPADGSKNVSLDTIIEIEYNKPINSTMPIWVATTFYDIANPKVQWAPDGILTGNKIVYEKLKNLKPGTTYKFEVKGFGNGVEDFSFTFTTGK